MDCTKCRILVPIAVLGTALLGACERPSARAIASPSGIYARSSGAVPSQPASELPRDAAAAALVPESRDAISDTVITGKIKAAIFADSGMAGADVSVNSDHGIVILAGTVKSYEQAGIASAHAQRQDGVMRVDNQLTLAGS